MNEILVIAVRWYLLLSSALGCLIVLFGLAWCAMEVTWRTYQYAVGWNKIYVCDFCGKPFDYGMECFNCGKDCCYDCGKTHMQEYQHGIYCGGSGDIRYCKQCDKDLQIRGDKRQAAYLRVQRLRAEGEAWSKDYRARCEEAEAAVKKFGRPEDKTP